jgi:hypothetical protein
MITLVKFMPNPQDSESPSNKLITRTLGKIGVLHGPTLQQSGLQPQSEEFWFVRVVKEKGAGTPQGLFLLEPLEKVKLSKKFIGEPDIIHIIPGTYQEEWVGNVLLIHPNVSWFPDRLGPNWIVGQSIKYELMRMHNDKDQGLFKLSSIILVFDRAHDWPKEPLRSSAPLASDAVSSTSTPVLDKPPAPQ